MPRKPCMACGQLPPCTCDIPAPPDTLRLVVLEQQDRVLRRTKGIEDACRIFRAYAAVPTELSHAEQVLVEEALATVRNLLLPQPQPPRVQRGRRPGFETHEELLKALENGQERFPHKRLSFTKSNFADYVYAKAPDGEEYILKERALTDNMRIFGVSWLELKRQYKLKCQSKNGKKSGG